MSTEHRTPRPAEHWLLLRCTSWRLGLAGWTTFALSVSYLARQRKTTR